MGSTTRLVRKRALLVLVCLVFVLGSTALGLTWFQSRRDLAMGIESLDRRDAAKALTLFQRSIRWWPWRAEAHLQAARAAREEGLLDEAEGFLAEAQRRGAAAENITVEEYLLELRRGNVSPGVERMVWHRIDTEHPRSSFLLEGLGQAYLYQYRLGEARDCAERWVARDPDDPQARFFRGLVREALQAMNEAGEDYRRAVDLDPLNPRFRHRLAEWCLLRHHTREAARLFEDLHSSFPDRWEYQLGLARARLQLAEYDHAQPLLDDLIQRPGVPVFAVLERARLALARRQFDDAERFYRLALERDASSAEACRGLTQVLAWAGRTEESETFRRRADEIEADLDRLHKLVERLGKSPADIRARYEAALICLRNGQKAEARRWLLSILRLRPDHQPSLEALARCD